MFVILTLVFVDVPRPERDVPPTPKEPPIDADDENAGAKDARGGWP